MSNESLRAELIGSDTASCEGLTVKAPINKGVLPILARSLIEQRGFDPLTRMEVYRNGTRCFSSLPLTYWARRQILETDNEGFRFKKYRPMNKANEAGHVE